MKIKNQSSLALPLLQCHTIQGFYKLPLNPTHEERAAFVEKVIQYLTNAGYAFGNHSDSEEYHQIMLLVEQLADQYFTLKYPAGIGTKVASELADEYSTFNPHLLFAPEDKIKYTSCASIKTLCTSHSNTTVESEHTKTLRGSFDAYMQDILLDLAVSYNKKLEISFEQFILGQSAPKQQLKSTTPQARQKKDRRNLTEGMPFATVVPVAPLHQQFLLHQQLQWLHQQLQ